MSSFYANNPEPPVTASVAEANEAAELAEDWASKAIDPVEGSNYSAEYNAALAATEADRAETAANTVDPKKAEDLSDWDTAGRSDTNIVQWNATLEQYEHIANPGAASIDHGNLTGLTDDDHSQYHTNARGDARYVQSSGGTFSGAVTFEEGAVVQIGSTTVAQGYTWGWGAVGIQRAFQTDTSEAEVQVLNSTGGWALRVLDFGLGGIIQLDALGDEELQAIGLEPDGGVTLGHNGSGRITTTATGATVTGAIAVAAGGTLTKSSTDEVLDIQSLTQAEYDALSPDATTLYLITG